MKAALPSNHLLTDWKEEPPSLSDSELSSDAREVFGLLCVALEGEFDEAV